MNRFGEYLEFASHVAAGLGEDCFALLDVGCSGGIDAGWRFLAERLQAWCFDPNVAEIERLRRSETLPAVEYVSGFVAAPPDHPFLCVSQGRPTVSRNPWGRLAVWETMTRQAARVADMSVADKTYRNEWAQLPLDQTTVVLSDFVRERGIRSIDFAKIDIDGKDFEILQSLSEIMQETQILGFVLEVNFIGADNETDHTHHNTDRFMRAQGYDLFDLEIRRYSHRHLPSRYLWDYPALTVFGRPLQGDALYIRDICAEHNRQFAESLTTAKKLKLAMLYSLFSLPDCAAEVLETFAAELAPRFDIGAALDLLAIQAQLLSRIRNDSGGYMTYAEYMKAFEDNQPVFYSGYKDV
jgi:FkbM family methyltransferase